MKITSVKPDSLGELIGLSAGDELLKIDNVKVRDEIDYHFKMSENEVILDLIIAGEHQQIEIEKEIDDDLGVEFEEFKIRSCANNCVFCFAAQNPTDMRQALYFKDGDFRMSYLYGHYITMTNMGSQDLCRIVEQNLSPLYISVHATEPELRKDLFLYNKDDRLLEKIEFLCSNGIKLHTQIVLMPNLNDGDYLLKTLSDLYQFFPQILTVSIVPVGLTKHRNGLRSIAPVTPMYAKSMVNQFQNLQHRFSGKNTPFLFLSDEWYILSDTTIPKNTDFYNDNLVENGVGQVNSFLSNFENEKDKLPKSFRDPIEFTIITGTLISNLFKKEVGAYLNSIPNLKVNVIPIFNDFFGHSVTVTGLLTGQDIIAQLKNKNLGAAVWTSNRILNNDGKCTLDDVLPSEIGQQIGVNFLTSNDSISEIFERNIIG